MNLANVQVANQGNYSVVISNSFGTATSVNAVLTVDDGLVTRATINLISLTGVWRYNQSGTDLGTAWKEVSYPAETGWPSRWERISAARSSTVA